MRLPLPVLLAALVLLGVTAPGCRKAQAQGPHCVRVADDWGPDGTVPFTTDIVAEGLEVP